MKSSSEIKWLTAACLLDSSVAAHAEGGCPDGQYPASGQGWQTCYPIPGYDQRQQTQTQAPPEKWVDHWGAIAIYEPTSSLGVASNLTSQKQAEQAALANCQAQYGSPCEIKSSYRNGCEVLIGGTNGYAVASKETLDGAVQAGMKICAANGYQNCHVYTSSCSLPQRIQ